MEEQSYIAFIRSKIPESKMILNAACAVIDDGTGKILLQKRSDNLQWGLPGGLLELDESIAGAALREVKEETNLEVELLDFLGVFVNPLMRWRDFDEAQVIGFYFTARIVGGTLRVNDSESTELRFFAQNDMPAIAFPDNRQAIDAYFSHQHHLIEGRAF